MKRAFLAYHFESLVSDTRNNCGVILRNMSGHQPTNKHRNRGKKKDKLLDQSSFVQWPSAKHKVVSFFYGKQTSPPLNIHTIAASFGKIRKHTTFPYNNTLNVTNIEMSSSQEAERLWQQCLNVPVQGVTCVKPNPNTNLHPNGSGKNNKQKEKHFKPYLAKDLVELGLSRKELISGSIRINQRKYTHAFISDADGKDILIDGMQDRNRALNGDVVAVRIKPESEWVIGTDSKLDNLAAQVQALNVSSSKSSNDAVSSPKRPGAPSFKQTRKTGEVVAIIKEKNSRMTAGKIKMEDANKKSSVVLFSPVSSIFPRLYIPKSSISAEIEKQDLTNVLFTCRLVKWEEDSKLPLGELCQNIGEGGQIEPETKRILVECDVDDAEFSDAVIDCLPKNLPWSISAEERSKRRDFTKECIFSIDPASARDLDDALHCNRLPDGNYEVGVHIADVSHFVKPNTELDKVASQRCTSVYLVQRVIPMLPRLLCEELCSLNPSVERLAFSCVWKVSEKGKILSEWFGRSIIRSCAKLSYDHAQACIDGTDDESTCEFPQITEGFTKNVLKQKILDLHKIAQNLRSDRIQGGALRLDQVKLSYVLSEETGYPSGCYSYIYKKSNELIEEFMLMANMAVARALYTRFPTLAFLRSHPPPKEDMMDDIKNHCDAIGLSLDVSSAKNLAHSLRESSGDDDMQSFRKQALYLLAIKPQQLATYLCSGISTDPADYHHYALNVPLYTHFTSPIRRYADLVVHRQLAALLGDNTDMKGMGNDPDQLNLQAEMCNHRKANSKTAQELSSELFFCNYVKNFGPFDSKAMVLYIHDHAADVLSIEYGVTKRIYFDNMPLLSYKLEEERVTGKNLQVNVMKLKWPMDGNLENREPVGFPAPNYEEAGQGREQTLNIFSLIDIQLKADDSALNCKAFLQMPSSFD